MASPQGGKVAFQVDAPAESSPPVIRPPEVPLARVPSYAQPRHLKRRQPPLLERVQQFVEQFGRNGSDAQDMLRSTSYYASQVVADAAMVKGMPSRGTHTTRTVRRLAEERQALAGMKKHTPARAAETCVGGGGKALRQLRERMHRATQGLPITPLPSRLLATFGPKDPNVELPDSAEHNALTWLGLLRIKKCGLCNVGFAVDALVTSVSVKAIHHLRNQWEVRRKVAGDASGPVSSSQQDVPLAESHHSHGSTSHGDHASTLRCGDRPKATPHPEVAAHAYTATRVCRYCAQFFGVFLGARFDEAPARKRRTTALRKQSLQKPVKPLIPGDVASNGSSQDNDDDHDFEEEEEEEEEDYEEERQEPSIPCADAQSPTNNKRGESPSIGSGSSRSSSASSRASSSSSSSATTRSSASDTTAVRRDIHVAALQPPSRPVTATRASLLRRSHHYHVVHDAPCAGEDANDMRVQDNAKQLAKQAHGGKQGKPVAVPVTDVFVLGPSSDSEPEVVRAHATPPTHATSGAAVEGSAVDEDAALTPHVTTGMQHPASERVRHASWNGAVRVLVMVCQAYQHRIGMPAALVPMATRLGHWCSQVFHCREDVVGAALENVQIVRNDEVTASAVYSFLEACVAERAAPLMFFLGLVEHTEDAFGDVALHLTNTTPTATVWPSGYQQRLAESEAIVKGGQREGLTLVNRHETRRQEPIWRRPQSSTRVVRSEPPPTFNPLASAGHAKGRSGTAAANSGSERPLAFTVGAIDVLCSLMGLAHPLLVVDSCFGPLMARTNVLTLVHPARPTAASQSAAAVPLPIPCGCVVDALTKVVEAMIGEDRSIPTVVATTRGTTSPGRHGASPLKADTQWKGCDWESVVGRLHASGDAGIVAQTLFHCHMREDEGLGPLVVTCPRRPTPVRHMHPVRLPLHRPLPRTASSDGSVFSFPVASTAVEMHVEHPAALGAVAVEDEALLRSAAGRVSQTFAMRLSPRHNVQRLSNATQQLRLAEALQAALRLDPTTASMDSLNFNIAVVLSGHVTIFVSSVSQLLLQQAAAVLASHRTYLGDCGWGILDYGFVVAREELGDERLSLDSVMDQNNKSRSSKSSVYILDIHTREV